MNALELANLLYILIQSGQLYPDAMILFSDNVEKGYDISENKMFIEIRK